MHHVSDTLINISGLLSCIWTAILQSFLHYKRHVAVYFMLLIYYNLKLIWSVVCIDRNVCFDRFSLSVRCCGGILANFGLFFPVQRIENENHYLTTSRYRWLVRVDKPRLTVEPISKEFAHIQHQVHWLIKRLSVIWLYYFLRMQVSI